MNTSDIANSKRTLQEREHSLKYHQERIIVLFEHYKKEIETRFLKRINNKDIVYTFPSRRSSEADVDYYLRSEYSFATVFARIHWNAARTLMLEQFDLYRIELSKAMNLVEELIVHICNYNIDASVLKTGFMVQVIQSAFAWLLYYSNSAEKCDVQDINRLKAFYRLQIEHSTAPHHCPPVFETHRYTS